jgi:hypothetical protein
MMLYRKPISPILHYYALVSSRAATILNHSEQGVGAMWGRLLTCGGLSIRLPRPHVLPTPEESV